MVNDRMTMAEVSEYLHIPRETLRYWRKKRRGPTGVRVEGGKVYYKRSEVHDWERRQEAADPLAKVRCVRALGGVA